MKQEKCLDCGTTENLIEEGGQFCGTWYKCQPCIDISDANWKSIMAIINSINEPKPSAAMDYMASVLGKKK